MAVQTKSSAAQLEIKAADVEEIIVHRTKTGGDGLVRSLQARHIYMIAIGGAIGTGLFLGSGATIGTAGPGGSLLAYAVIGIMVYFVMTSLGEMATYLPVSGSFETYATRFVDPAFGFALGWNYWLNGATCLASELVASAILMKFWFPDTLAIAWSALFLAVIFGFNIISTRAFGESKYWFAGVKVMTIIVFLAIGISIIFGLTGGKSPGFSNWVIGDAPFVGGIEAFMSILMIAGYSFQGIEQFGIAAGESSQPEHTIPKAIGRIFWRIVIFYIGALIVLAFIIPYTDPNLLKNDISDVAVSPFTLVFMRAGLLSAATVMNAVILTAVLSAANSAVYASTRMLYAMAVEGKAPGFFRKLNRRHVPVNALIFTSAIGLFAFITSAVADGIAYRWLINATGVIGFVAWLGIALSHYRFRKALICQGKDPGTLAYRALWFPFGPLFALALCLFIVGGQGWCALTNAHVKWWYDLGVAYAGLLVFLCCYIGYKVSRKTRLVPLSKVDLGRES